MREDYSKILERMKNEYRRYAGYTPDDASDIGIRMKTLAGEIFSLESSIDFLKRQMFPTTATGKYLDMHAAQRQISRQGATPAKGKLMFAPERPLPYDFTVPAGTVCSVSDGSLRFVTDTDTVISAGTSYVLIDSHSEQGGSKYNIPINTVSSVVTYFSEAIYVGNLTPFSGGADAESDEELRARIAESYRNPSTGMNETYYKQLAMSVDGVFSASVRALTHGTGTVGVYVAARGKKVSDDVLAEVQAIMDMMRPICVTVFVESPELSPVNVKVTVSVCSGYNSEDVKKNVNTAIKNYFNSMGVGESFRLCGAGETIYHVPGVESYSFDTNVTKDSEGTPKILYTLGTLTINAS